MTLERHRLSADNILSEFQLNRNGTSEVVSFLHLVCDFILILSYMLVWKWETSGLMWARVLCSKRQCSFPMCVPVWISLFIEREVGVVNTVSPHFHKRRKCCNVETNFPFLSYGITYPLTTHTHTYTYLWHRLLQAGMPTLSQKKKKRKKNAGNVGC